MPFKVNRAFVAFVCLLLGSCAMSPREVRSTLIGDCISLKKEQLLLKGKGGHHFGRFLIADEKYSDYWSVLGILPAGTDVVVGRILSASNGSFGSFLRVQVTIRDGKFAGVIADVPVHAPYHPSGKWTKKFTLDPNALEFNKEIVVPCD